MLEVFFIENDTNKILKVHIESSLSTYQAPQGFTTIRPKSKKEVKFTFPSLDRNSLIKCSIFTKEMVKIIDSETLENSNSYKLEKLGNGFILEPLGNFYILMNYNYR